MRKKILTFLLLSCIGVKAQETDFFVNAHQDDAVFFAGSTLYTKINSNFRTVCIVTTAGDGNNGVIVPTTSTNLPVAAGAVPYYLARDYGLEKAIEYCYTSKTGTAPISPFPSVITQTFAGKTVRKWEYGNVVVYFLDLPDRGCCSLDPSVSTGQSLIKLKRGNISSITNITGTTTYTWVELKNTIKAIFNLEKNTNLSYPNNVYSSEILFSNPGYVNADHCITSVLALESMDGMTGFNSKLHTDYDLKDLDLNNLSELDKVKKISTYGAMISGGLTKGYRLTRHYDLNTEYRWLNSEKIRDVVDIHNELENLNPELGGNPFGPPNIALNKNASASCSDSADFNQPKANDGSLETYWGCSGSTKTWQVDLGTSYTVTDFKVIGYYKDTRYYKYKVYASNVTTPGSGDWGTAVYDKSTSSLSTINGDTFTFSTPITARHFKVEFYDTVVTGDPFNKGAQIVEFIAHGTAVTNIAYLKSTTASTTESPALSSYANDNNPGTYWAGGLPATWNVDLGATYKVSDIKVVTYSDGTRKYLYKVYASNDASSSPTNWFEVADKNVLTTSTSTGDTFNFSPHIAARHFRVVMSYNSANGVGHLVDFVVHGVASSYLPGVSSIDNQYETKILFKNPTKIGEKLEINLSNNEKIENIQLYDLNGKERINEKFSNEKVNINTDFLSKGTYIIHVNDIGSKIIFE